MEARPARAANVKAARATDASSISLKPVRMAARAIRALPAPSHQLTRELVAMPMASGIMYNTAAKLEAIWWLAEAMTPWRAMNSAISVNDVTSTMMASPPGMPRRANSRMRAQSGRSSRCQMR